MYPQYNLSINCVDGDTIYGVISSNKKLVLNFLDEHDHEGSTILMIKRVSPDKFFTLDSEETYLELAIEY